MAATDPTDALVRDLVTWVGAGGRAYADVMDAWKTSCPRLPVWEEANARGFVETDRGMVRLTARGRDLLGGNGGHS